MKKNDLFLKYLEVTLMVEPKPIHGEKARQLISMGHDIIFIDDSLRHLPDQAGEFYNWVVYESCDPDARPAWLFFGSECHV